MIFTRDPNVGSKEESNKDGDKEGGIRHTKVRAPEWSLWWNFNFLVLAMQQHLCGELDEPFLDRAGGNPEVGVSHQGKIPQGNRGTNPDRNLWNIVGRLSALNYFCT